MSEKVAYSFMEETKRLTYEAPTVIDADGITYKGTKTIPAAYKPNGTKGPVPWGLSRSDRGIRRCIAP